MSRVARSVARARERISFRDRREHVADVRREVALSHYASSVRDTVGGRTVIRSVDRIDARTESRLGSNRGSDRIDARTE